MILLFVQQKQKHGKVAFLTFRSASKHILFALGVDPTARNASEGGGSDRVSQATPFAVSCGLVSTRDSLCSPILRAEVT